jgi:hypothetical protein
MPSGYFTVLTSPNQREVSEMRDDEEWAIPRFGQDAGYLCIQRIHRYLSTGTFSGPSSGARLQIVAMIPPRKPGIRKEKNKLVVTWDRSPLRDHDLLQEYRVEVTAPFLTFPLRYRAQEEKLEISVNDLRDLQAAEDFKASRKAFQDLLLNAGLQTLPQGDLSELFEIWRYARKLRGEATDSGGPQGMWRATLREVGNFRTVVEGPASEEVFFDPKLNEIEVEPFDVTGRWRGRILFTHEYVEMNVDSANSEIAFRIEGGDRQTGRWDASKNGWLLGNQAKFDEATREWPQQVRDLVRPFATAVLRRFPGERLWWEFPPMLMRR